MMQRLKDKQSKKIKKPDFSTKEGRGMLAYILQKEFEYILNIDKDAETPFIKRVKEDFVPRFTKRMIENPTKKIMIGICGESASGKTTICKHIKKAIGKFNLPVEIISTDNYFNDISELIKQHGGFDKFLESGYDLDAPSNFMTEQLKEDIKMLADGYDVMTPQYLINGSGVNIPHSLPAKSQKIIAVEGLAAMYDNVYDLFDIKIYIDIDRQEQEERFLARAASRNQNRENALKQLKYIREASEKYILPHKHKWDIIVNGSVSIPYFEQIIEYLYGVTNNFE
ncbi:MAG: hypothetical protein K6C94_00085 [Candidatus Gastranaerophilales bacterium]|nr:hypothetical protein [Candidatus Gastranaerophilales bacterium]